MIVGGLVIKKPTKKQKKLFADAMQALDLQLDVEGKWTDGRPTSDRYKKTNTSLARIKNGLANGELLIGDCEHETLQEQGQRLEGGCNEDTRWV